MDEEQREHEAMLDGAEEAAMIAHSEESDLFNCAACGEPHDACICEDAEDDDFDGEDEDDDDDDNFDEDDDEFDDTEDDD